MTAQTKRVLAIAAFLALAIFVVLGLGLFGGASDKEKIQLALKEAIEASKEGRPGGVLELLSKELTVNEVKYPTGQISKFIREKKPGVDILSQEPVIAGGSATIETPVKFHILTFERTIPQVTLHFEKEDTRKWLFFPARDWKMTRVELSEETLGEIQSMSSGF